MPEHATHKEVEAVQRAAATARAAADEAKAAADRAQKVATDLEAVAAKKNDLTALQAAADKASGEIAAAELAHQQLAAAASAAMSKANSAGGTATSAMNKADSLNSEIAALNATKYWLDDRTAARRATSIGAVSTVTVTFSIPAPNTDYSIACSITSPSGLLGSLSASPVLASRTTTTCQIQVKNSALIALSLGAATLHVVAARGYRPS